jgi:amino acid transporter
VLSIFGIVIGSLIQARWAPGQTWSWQPFSTAPHIGLPHVIAIIAIVAVWAFNIFGIRPAVWVSYITGAMLMIPLAVFIFVPYLTGDWHSSNLHWSVAGPWGGWKLAIVYLYVMGWSAYGVETCATFAPEYKDTVRDTALALRSAAIFSLAVYTLLPLGITGAIGEKAAVNDPVSFYVPAFEKIVGGWASGVMVVLLIASLLLSMNTATADGSRALYGIARDHMTVKELYHLNRFRVPSRAMTLDMVMNILLVLLVGNTLSILVAGNLGYISAHFFALTGFLLLRKDRPNWPRPIRLPAVWLPIAGLLAAVNFVLIIIGASSNELTGYGGAKETWIGVGVLAFSIVLFAYRRLVQDKQPIHLREETPQVPGEQPVPAAAGVPAT